MLRPPRGLRWVVLCAFLTALLGPAALAQAAGAPQVGAVWVTEVSSASVRFNGEVDPEGLPTTYRFEYITDAAYKENLARGREGFAGAALAPAGLPGKAGSGLGYVTVEPQEVTALLFASLYDYRLTATSADGTTPGLPHAFITQQIVVRGPEGCPNNFLREENNSQENNELALPDCRAYEMVSPPEKNGGAIQGPERNHGGDVLQAAAAGGEITYSSASSFGEEAKGAPPASQYISRRTQGGWTAEDLTVPIVSGSYGNEPNGVPYQLFSADLARGLMLNGLHCRGEGTDCPVLNPPLPGSGAPNGYQDYYLRDNEDGSYTAVVTEANAELHLEATEFNLAFAGASPDLHHLVFSTCATLTPGATEVPGSEGCDPTKPNLYEYTEGRLSLINVAPGAALAAQGGAVSADGSRVYFTEAGKLWLREGSGSPHELAAGGEFQTATPDGASAFYTVAGHLYSYSAASHSSTDLTPSGGVEGVLGASEDGSRVYYATPSGIFLSQAGVRTPVAAPAAAQPAAQPSDYPPTTGTARVSAGGETLLFLSKAPLTGYDNTDQSTGQPDSEVFLYDASGGGRVTCLSCNPTDERPIGPSTIPGAVSNGTGPDAVDVYKPRVLSADSHRVFFDSSDALVPLDANHASDVYQWEAQGEGTCQRPDGCLDLISSGKDPEGASFVDASADGSDVYFLTSASLVSSDPGSADIYDARIGGGFPVAKGGEICVGESCIPLPPPVEEPPVGTMIPGPANPPVSFPKIKTPGKQHRHHRRRHKRATRHRRGHR
ncbi:MAG TPA: hypothetical protein VND98_11930 [Solirubrobacterales bacterium]|nr:hypothetical protein [Solirubrobacterales bacterium]